MNKDSVIKYFVWAAPAVIFVGLVGGVVYYKAKTGGPSANAEVVINKPVPHVSIDDATLARIDAKIKSLNDQIAATPGDQNVKLHDLYISVGQNLEAEGKFNEALADYLKSISLAPQLVEGYIDSGNIYEIQGQASKAEKIISKPLILNPIILRPIKIWPSCISKTSKSRRRK